MKINKVFLAGIALLLGAFIYALNYSTDWYDFASYSFTTIKDSNIEDKGVENEQSAFSISIPSNVLLEDDFEGATSNWTFTNSSAPAKWHIGSAVKSSGSKSLYVSEDNGATNEYSTGSTTIHAISPSVTLDNTTTEYLFSFDWRARAESSWDFLSLWLVPDAYTPQGGSAITALDSGGLELSRVYGEVDFINVKIIKDLSAFKGMKVKVVFQWRHDTSGYNNPPGAVDNFEFAKNTCKAPDFNDLKVSAISLSGAQLDWAASSTSTTDFDVFVGTTATLPSTVTNVIHKGNSTTHTLSNLQPSTYYYVWYRSSCAVGDESYWVGPLKFMTLCDVLTLPFSETFNADSPSFGCWRVLDEAGDASTSLKNIWKIAKNVDQNYFDAMYFDGDSKQHSDYLISPEFMLTGGMYKLEFDYKTGDLSESVDLLMSLSGLSATDFTIVVQSDIASLNTQYKKKVVLIQGHTGKAAFAWHVKSNQTSKLYIDNFSIEEVTCSLPTDIALSNLGDTSASVGWNDAFSNSWEYYVQPLGYGMPSTNGIATTTTDVSFTAETSGTALTPSTEYEVFVRSKCSNGTFSEWVGPIDFTTKCSAIKAFPFQETFNTDSTTFDCWTMHPNQGSNMWKRYNYSIHEGDRTMYFSPTSTTDSWLISPTFEFVQGAIYELNFYYRGNSTSSKAKFDVLLSSTGTNPANFTTSLESDIEAKTTSYLKKTIYIQGQVGKVNLAWHALASSNNDVYIDLVTIERVNCFNPIIDDVTLSGLQSNSVTFSWLDNNNSTWEYYLQLSGAAAPTGNGLSINNKTVTVTTALGTPGGALQPDTQYDFYLRSSCSNGKGKWVGPITFRTPCTALLPPFWEGFNTDSPTINCWESIQKPGNNSNWTLSNTKYEGDKSYYYAGNDGDNWLISPQIVLDVTKYYILKFHYRTDDYYQTDFKVKLSKTGGSINGFTTTLLDIEGDSNDNWREEVIVLKGIGGNINIAWQVKNPDEYVNLYIDNVFLEEVSCPQPLKLDATNITTNGATLTWEDQVGTNWEYIVQSSGGNTPLATATGKATATKTNPITTDHLGTALLPNTEYEYYVRSKCSTTDFSVWSGPFTFRTLCDIQSLPYWEGFNTDSMAINCWTVLNENKDFNTWSLKNYDKYEGSHGIGLEVYDYMSEIETDDWLVSPTFTFLPGKVYRLRYHYKGSPYYEDNNFEVLASNGGIQPTAFTKELVEMEAYSNGTFVEKKVFISGLSGNVNIAWHALGSGNINIYIDNVFVEEVIGCPEPINNEVTDIESKKATLNWEDDFSAADWEYYVVEDGSSAPTTTTVGVKTKTKQNIVTKDGVGNNLKPNTDYEYYVRTVCSNGGYSIWVGPFKFVTACDVYQAPFWEGFNTDSKSVRCWTIYDSNEDVGAIGRTWRTTSTAYEGDQAWYFSIYNGQKTLYNDWLVSPMVELDGGQYILKYHYKTSAQSAHLNQFEVKLSTTGSEPSNFNTTLVPSKIYNVDNYVEEVVFINGIQGNVNIGWHINAINTNYSYLYLDNVTLKKIVTCPEPYYVKTSNSTTTGFDVEWQQTGGVTSWEVIVLAKGDPITATPIQTIPVIGTPKVTITGLSSSTLYTIYVRAKCSAATTSDISTPAIGSVKVGANNNCGNAAVLPVSSTDECESSIAGSLYGATISTAATPDCKALLKYDSWYEFTATAPIHSLNIEDLFSASGGGIPTIFGALYTVGCTGVTATNTVACFNLTMNTPYSVFEGFIPGQKYYVRLGTENEVDISFNICVTTLSFINVTETFTAEELVKDILVLSNCDLISNVTSRTGTDFGESNGIGYFSNENSAFGFKEGIILATNAVKLAEGPSSRSTGSDSSRWLGDLDLEKILIKNGQTGGSHNASVLEFDFIPITDDLKFNFILASNEYGSFQCDYADVFAFILTDLTTGEQTNLAVVPNTNIPVAVTTIRDSKYNGSCESLNVEYFDKYYNANGIGGLAARLNPINYGGRTVPLTAETDVVPGRKYHIKLAIADYRDSSYDSAVFLEAGSFDLGTLDLGADLLVETGTALCDGEPKLITSGLSGDADLIEIEWYKDDVLIPGANSPDYSVSESGTYKVIGRYKNINCPIEGEVKVEIFPLIHTVVKNHSDVAICRYTLDGGTIDLTADELNMFTKSKREDFELAYYKDVDLADLIVDPTQYGIKTENVSHTIYLHLQNVLSGCTEVLSFELVSTKGEVPTKPENVLVCEQYILPELEANQTYYTESLGQGVHYKSGDTLLAGKYTLYILQDNGSGCFEETFYEVEVTAKPLARIFEDQLLSCELYTLKELDEYSKYYIEVGGVRVEMPVGSVISKTNTKIYVVAKSENEVCVDESSFMIRYEECPIPKGISPNGDGFNDNFDLTKYGVSSIKIFNRNGTEVYSFQGSYTNEWYGQTKSGKELPSGTYYYVIQSFDKTRTGWVELIK